MGIMYRDSIVSNIEHAWYVLKLTEDIGLDSKQVAAKALGGFRFKPALKNGSPVAVWILHRIRFEFQE